MSRVAYHANPYGVAITSSRPVGPHNAGVWPAAVPDHDPPDCTPTGRVTPNVKEKRL